MKMIIDSVGRVQIPKELRAKYNLEIGSKYKITECKDYLKVEPFKEIYTITADEMTTLRKLYLMLSESGLLDNYYETTLADITKKADIKCDKCNSPLFLTKDNSYKCFKCGDE